MFLRHEMVNASHVEVNEGVMYQWWCVSIHVPMYVHNVYQNYVNLASYGFDLPQFESK